MSKKFQTTQGHEDRTHSLGRKLCTSSNVLQGTAEKCRIKSLHSVPQRQQLAKMTLADENTFSILCIEELQ